MQVCDALGSEVSAYPASRNWCCIATRLSVHCASWCLKG